VHIFRVGESVIGNLLFFRLHSVVVSCSPDPVEGMSRD
jgi:hypothetical protein